MLTDALLPHDDSYFHLVINMRFVHRPDFTTFLGEFPIRLGQPRSHLAKLLLVFSV